MKDKQVWKNMFFSIVSFLVTYTINFFLTPYISENLPGTYGYVKLSNDIVSYAQLITMALNSMAGRFISIEFNRGNIKKAKAYFSSVLWANIGMVLLLFVPASIVIFKLDAIFNVDLLLIRDVKFLFICTFSSFFVGIIFSVYSLATFIKNRLDYEYEINMVTSLIRLALLVVLFGFFGKRVYFIGMAALIVTTVKAILQYVIKKKLLPELKVDYKMVDIKLVVQLVSTGIWNTIQGLGQILLDGLDTLISNILINPVAMNNISFAKTMPGIIASLLNTMAGVFSPKYTILYAKGEEEELKQSTKQTMIFLSLVISIPVGIIIAVGREFYSLWIPSENISEIYLLSTLSSLVYVVSTPMNAVYNLFTVKNRVRYLALVTLGSGIVSTILVLILVRYTGFGVYAIAGCSAGIGIIRNVFLVAPYAANMMGYSRYTFYPEILKSVLSVFFVYIIATVTKYAVCIDTWISFIIACLIIVCLSLIVNLTVLFNRNQKQRLLLQIKEKVEK